MKVVRYMLDGRPITKVVILVETDIQDLDSVLQIGPASHGIKSVTLLMNMETLTTNQFRTIALQFPSAKEVALKLRKLDDVRNPAFPWSFSARNQIADL